ncbi:MAG: hypothetical protein GY801_27095 [bacterium]|nr:hypothetical protein [bacterium]
MAKYRLRFSPSRIQMAHQAFPPVYREETAQLTAAAFNSLPTTYGICSRISRIAPEIDLCLTGRRAPEPIVEHTHTMKFMSAGKGQRFILSLSCKKNG